MEKSWCSAESGMGPLYDPWTRTSHLTVPAATTQEAKEMKLASHPSATSFLYTAVLASCRLWWRDYLIFLFLTLIFKGCSIHWSAGTCFTSWVEPPMPQPCQMSDFKALERSVSTRPYLPSLKSMWNQIMAVTGTVWICCCGFYYWVLYLWWLIGLYFSVLETLHFIWQISSMLQASIKGSFYNLKLWL